MKRFLPLSALFLALILAFSLLSGCGALSEFGFDLPGEETEPEIWSFPPQEETEPSPTAQTEENGRLDENGSYTSREDVALYLVQYGRLPRNFITKEEARALGWPGGDLRPYAPDKCIGGDVFGNYEKRLPTGRTYHECDIDTLGKKKRGEKRLIYSDDGWIYYTEDHYETFTLLYRNGEKV